MWYIQGFVSTMADVSHEIEEDINEFLEEKDYQVTFLFAHETEK